MKIRRLIIPEYKNVKVDVALNADMITLLVGQNGMGKSNLLEVLLLIFDELSQISLYGKQKNEEHLMFDYTLEYECRGCCYKVVKEGNEHHYWEQCVDKWKAISKLTRESQPSRIVGYYSGENKRVRALVAKHIKREESSKRRKYSKGVDSAFEPKRLFFAENRHSMMVLTTMLLYREHPQYGANIRKVLKDVVHIENWRRIHLQFHNPDFAKMWKLRKEGKTLEEYKEKLTEAYDLEDTSIFWGVKGNVDKLMRLLLYYAIDHNLNFSIFSRGSREYFDIESIPSDDKFRELLFDWLPAPMDFLNAMEECFVLNMIESFDILVQKADEKTFYSYLHLSEGEQQYLTVMGLVALAHSQQDETLFLLDEPDTHINPQWQRSYIKHILELSNTEADKRSKLFFISTHSPLLVQANSRGNNDVDILLFKWDENGQIQIDTDEEVVNNWRIDQVLMSKYFDLPSSRPVSLDEFMNRRKSVMRNYDGKAISNELANYTDEYGYLPTGETMADIEAMVYIHHMAELLKKDGHL